MTKREKLYGWIIVAALSVPSMIAGFSRKYFSLSRYGLHVRPGFYFFALAIPVILVIAWLWILSRRSAGSQASGTEKRIPKEGRMNKKRGFRRLVIVLSIVGFVLGYIVYLIEWQYVSNLNHAEGILWGAVPAAGIWAVYLLILFVVRGFKRSD